MTGTQLHGVIGGGCTAQSRKCPDSKCRNGEGLHTRPAQYLFEKLGQTPWRTLAQEVIAYQFLLKSNNF